jgi:hypothetical protein
MVLITDAPAVGVVGLRGVAQRIAQGSTYFKILRFPRLPSMMMRARGRTAGLFGSRVFRKELFDMIDRTMNLILIILILLILFGGGGGYYYGGPAVGGGIGGLLLIILVIWLIMGRR